MFLLVSAVLWAVLLALRAPATMVFFSILVGQLLAMELGEDVYEFAGSLARAPDYQYVQLGLLLLPIVLTFLFLKFRVGKSKVIFEALPLLFTAICLLLFTAPLLPVLQDLISESGQIEPYKSLFIASASVSSLLTAWFTYPKSHTDKGKKHK